MPILTEEELQDIVNKESEAKTKLEEKNQLLVELNKERDELKSHKRGLVISTVLLGILFLSMVFTVIFQPHIFGLNEGVQLAGDEVIVKESTLKEYQDQILELESGTSQNVNPLELQEFYAVQLGAFKKFNIQLSSDNYSIVHNAKYDDFNLYTLGVFETQEEAEKLRKVITQLNFKDAFVGLYRDGERVDANY